MPATASSSRRRTSERRCRWHTGQPAKRRSCRCTSPAGCGSVTRAPVTVVSSRSGKRSSGFSFRLAYIIRLPIKRTVYAVKSMPRPRSLTLPQIAAAALAVLERDGLAALSMRTVAVELDVGTMSLYRYVDSKEQVEELVVGLVF